MITKKTKIDEGQHNGIIKEVAYRNKPYSYTDLLIEVEIEGNKSMLTASYPTMVNEDTGLGQLLIRFGADLNQEKINPNTILEGRSCVFQTQNKETPKGTFANVLTRTVIPDK